LRHRRYGVDPVLDDLIVLFTAIGPVGAALDAIGAEGVTAYGDLETLVPNDSKNLLLLSERHPCFVLLAILTRAEKLNNESTHFFPIINLNIAANTEKVYSDMTHIGSAWP
jgi:hypothetical protein